MKHSSSQRIDNGDTINNVVEKLNTNDLTFFISRKDFNHIPSHSKSPSVTIHIISHVLMFNELVHKIISLHLVPRKEHHPLIEIFFGRTYTVDTTYGCHHNNVFT